jgi:ethanolamine transporter EutH
MVKNLIQDIIVKHNKSLTSLEATKHIPIGCVVTRLIAMPSATPIALPAVSLNNIHLALIKSYILDSGVTEHVCND